MYKGFYPIFYSQKVDRESWFDDYIKKYFNQVEPDLVGALRQVIDLKNSEEKELLLSQLKDFNLFKKFLNLSYGQKFNLKIN